MLLFLGGLVLQYAVTGFATGVAAPAIFALGPNPNPHPNPHLKPPPPPHPNPNPHPNQAISALGGSSVQGRLMGVNQAVEAAGRMGGQVLVAVLYDISPLHACAMPVVANAIAAAAMALALALDRLHTRRAGLSAAVLV